MAFSRRSENDFGSEHRQRVLFSILVLLSCSHYATDFDACQPVGPVALEADDSTEVQETEGQQPRVTIKGEREINRRDFFAPSEVVKKVAEGGPDAIPKLIDLLQDQTKTVDVAEAVGAMGADAIAELTKGLQNSNPRIREGVAESLGFIGPPAGAAISALGQLLKDPDDKVRFSAVRALAKLGMPPRSAMPELIGLLDSKEWDVAASTQKVLGEMGPQAAAAVPRLARLLTEGDRSQEEVGEVLAAIWPASADALNKLLEEDDFAVRKRAFQAMSRVGPPGFSALFPYLRYRYPPDEFARLDPKNADPIDAMSCMGPTAAAAVPQLEKILRDSDQTLRISAAKMLGLIGPRAASTVVQLKQTLVEKDAVVQGAAVHALLAINDETKEFVIPALIERLDSPNGADRKGGPNGVGRYRTRGPARLAENQEIASR